MKRPAFTRRDPRGWTWTSLRGRRAAEPGADRRLAGNLPTIRDLTIPPSLSRFRPRRSLPEGAASPQQVTLGRPTIIISGGLPSPTVKMFDLPFRFFILGGEFYVYADSIWSPLPTRPAAVKFIYRHRQHTQQLVQRGAAVSSCQRAGAVVSTTASPNARGMDWRRRLVCVCWWSRNDPAPPTIPVDRGRRRSNATNSVNLPIPLGSDRCRECPSVAHSRTTPGNQRHLWTGWSMLYGVLTTVASGTTVVAGTKPTPVTTGTVTGTDIAVTADTTLGALNVTWTPPTSNVQLWDVAASVTYTQVR